MKRLNSLWFLLCLLATSLSGGRPASGQSSAYTSIVVFGDSLSDVGNAAAVSYASYGAVGQVPGVLTGYTNGRFTDGLDTTPAAKLYTGVWIEQLAAMLSTHPTVSSSLSGGMNYAYGFATTNTGTSLFTYGPGNALSFTVKNMGQQVSDYLATKPTINNKVLFVVWGGANDLIAATTSADLVNAAARDAAIIQQLITAGATNFVVPILPPLGLVPRYNSSAATSTPVNAASAAYNAALGAALNQLAMSNAGKLLNIYYLDTATLFNTVVATPSNYGFTNVTASSQLNASVNPDTYLFWDDLHPTTAGHHFIATSAYRLIASPVATNTSLALPGSSSVNLNSSITFKATVSNASGTSDTPMGTVQFVDTAGGGALGTGFLTGSGTSATATLSTSTLTAGTHAIQAVYTGVNGFGSSTSAFVSQTVVPPAFSAALSPTSQTVSRGSGGSTTVTITPTGGYTGAFTVACGTLPVHFSCSVQTSALTVTTAAVSTTISFATNIATSAVRTGTQNQAMLAFLGAPFLGGLALFARRRKILHSGVLSVFACALSFLALAALSGCGSDPYKNDSPAGTYTVPITVTPASGSATTLSLSVTVTQ